MIVQTGAVDALVPHLAAPPLLHPDERIAYEHEVEKDAAFALGLLAIKVRDPFTRRSMWSEIIKSLFF